jgi:hypothetical protein
LHAIRERATLSVRPLRPSPSTGVVGALVAVILISLILLSEGAELGKLREIVASSRFQTAQWIVLALSFAYGLRVRMMMFREEDMNRRRAIESKATSKSGQRD